MNQARKLPPSEPLGDLNGLCAGLPGVLIGIGWMKLDTGCVKLNEALVCIGRAPWPAATFCCCLCPNSFKFRKTRLPMVVVINVEKGTAVGFIILKDGPSA